MLRLARLRVIFAALRTCCPARAWRERTCVASIRFRLWLLRNRLTDVAGWKIALNAAPALVVSSKTLSGWAESSDRQILSTLVAFHLLARNIVCLLVLERLTCTADCQVQLVCRLQFRKLRYVELVRRQIIFTYATLVGSMLPRHLVMHLSFIWLLGMASVA